MSFALPVTASVEYFDIFFHLEYIYVTPIHLDLYVKLYVNYMRIPWIYHIYSDFIELFAGVLYHTQFIFLHIYAYFAYFAYFADFCCAVLCSLFKC